jgi:hypothetical protein
VCQECDNGFCSKADAGLVEHFKLEQRRNDLGLKGHNGVVPDPLKRALRKPIDSGAEPGHQVLISSTPNADGKYPARTVTRVEAKVEYDNVGNALVYFPVFFLDKGDADKAEMLIKSALRKAGLKDEEMLDIASRQAIAGLEAREVPDEIRYKYEQRSGGEVLGIVKSAYEFAHYWLGDKWLSDPVGTEMRKAIMGDKKTRGRYRIIEDGADGIGAENFDLKTHHSVILFRCENALFVNVRLLDIFSAYYLVSEQADAYDLPERNAVYMDVLTKRPILLKAVASSETTGLRLAYTGKSSNEDLAS